MKPIFLSFFIFSFSMPLYALVDQSHRLDEVLEYGTLSDKDCEPYRQGITDHASMLRCGKFMFFSDNLGVPGFPSGLVDLMRKKAPKSIGPSLEGFGLIKNPYSQNDLPIGMTTGPILRGGVPSYTPTCAFCHFVQLDDGRYIVGQANTKLDFAGLVLTTGVLSEMAFKPFMKLPPEAKQKLDPIIDEFFGHKLNRLAIIGQVIRLIPKTILERARAFNDEEKTILAKMPTGVFDLFFPPVIDDKVVIPVKILPLWGVHPDAMVAAGSTHGGMLSSTGGTPDWDHTFHSFVVVSDLSGSRNAEATHPPSYFKPLIAYIESLNAPKNLAKLDEIRVQRGQALFQQNCVSCHNGPAFAGTRVYSFDEIGTDPNLARQLDPKGTGFAIKDILRPYELTGGIRANHLDGIWSQDRLLHNGSLHSLRELFCLDGPRPAAIGEGLSTAGHRYTCDGLSVDEKLDTIEFLNSL